MTSTRRVPTERSSASIIVSTPSTASSPKRTAFVTLIRNFPMGGVLGLGVPLPEHVRKDILELGFPDDGYNYLLHLREIKNAGAGSAYYQNPKATYEPLPLDVKAYDASKVPVPKVTVEETKDDTVYNVAAKTVGVRLQKAIDPEVAALLGDDNLSQFDSDDDDLEEDFVVVANLVEGGAEENGWVIDEGEDSGVVLGSISRGIDQGQLNLSGNIPLDENTSGLDSIGEVRNQESGVVSDDIKQRVRRLLDDQFELLESQEYGSDEDDDCYGEPTGEEEDNLTDRFNHVLKDSAIDESEFGDQYKVPADLLLDGKLPEEILKSASDIIRKCTEYAEKYENKDENGNDNLVLIEETTDKSEV